MLHAPAAHGMDQLLGAMQELYGDQTAALFTGALSRLLTTYLQLHGFSCGVDDLLLQVGLMPCSWSLVGAPARCQLKTKDQTDDNNNNNELSLHAGLGDTTLVTSHPADMHAQPALWRLDPTGTAAQCFESGSMDCAWSTRHHLLHHVHSWTIRLCETPSFLPPNWLTAGGRPQQTRPGWSCWEGLRQLLRQLPRSWPRTGTRARGR